MGVAHEISSLLVRNFEYYTGPVFHVFVGDQKVGGGGRYDGLVSLVGGRALPAFGFAIEIDVVSPLLATVAEEATAITIRCESHNSADLARAFALAVALRECQALVRVTTGAASSGREVTVSEGAFLLSLNGGKPKRLAGIAEVVRAVSGS
jgi:histidyl-tRNA synthetase